MDVCCDGRNTDLSFSLYAMFTKSAEVYFDSVTMIVTFVFAGKYLEVLTKKRLSIHLMVLEMLLSF